jgi:hypothetical protein
MVSELIPSWQGLSKAEKKELDIRKALREAHLRSSSSAPCDVDLDVYTDPETRSLVQLRAELNVIEGKKIQSEKHLQAAANLSGFERVRSVCVWTTSACTLTSLCCP